MKIGSTCKEYTYFAGALNVLITNPLWVVNTRIKSQKDTNLKGLLRKYLSTIWLLPQWKKYVKWSLCNSFQKSICGDFNISFRQTQVIKSRLQFHEKKCLLQQNAKEVIHFPMCNIFYKLISCLINQHEKI